MGRKRPNHLQALNNRRMVNGNYLPSAMKKARIYENKMKFETTLARLQEIEEEMQAISDALVQLNPDCESAQEEREMLVSKLEPLIAKQVIEYENIKEIGLDPDAFITPIELMAAKSAAKFQADTEVADGDLPEGVVVVNG